MKGSFCPRELYLSSVILLEFSMLYFCAIETGKIHTALCVNCPRLCGASREPGNYGVCNTGNEFSIASITAHFGEEPVISGRRGICNIFFSHCNLQCIYCQNYQISRNDEYGTAWELEDIIRKITGLLDSGITSVGFVSPTHMTGQVMEIINALGKEGRKPAYVWNSNGYDRVRILKELEDVIDVYLPDFKYADAELGASLSGVDDYPVSALKAIKEMVRQKGTSLIMNDDGTVASGVIIRHLVLPGHVENSKASLRLIAEEISPAVTVSLMSQYHPIPGIKGHPELNRTLTQDEYEEVLDKYYGLGFFRGWTQDLASGSTLNPDFEKEDPFAFPVSE